MGIDKRAKYFGATVNLAARVASRAGSGQALVTATILTAIEESDLDYVALGPHRLRNVLEPVDLWAVELCATNIDITVDPVCRMRVSCLAAAAHVRHAGVEYRFCSLACVGAFAADPDSYLRSADGEPH